MKITCIKCPLGCELTVIKRGKVISVTGNTCERGALYGKEEITAPKRIVTSLIKGKEKIYPCKTSGEIPKDKIFDCLSEIGRIRVKNAKIGDIVCKNVANTGIDIVITGNGSSIK